MSNGPTTSELRARAVRELIAVHIDRPSTFITDEKKLRADLGVDDSLALIEMVLMLEDRFEIEIPDTSIDGAADITVADICKIVEERIADRDQIADHGAEPPAWLENLVPKSAEVVFKADSPHSSSPVDYKELSIAPAQIREVEIRVYAGGEPSKKAD